MLGIVLSLDKIQPNIKKMISVLESSSSQVLIGKKVELVGLVRHCPLSSLAFVLFLIFLLLVLFGLAYIIKSVIRLL